MRIFLAALMLVCCFLALQVAAQEIRDDATPGGPVNLERTAFDFGDPIFNQTLTITTVTNPFDTVDFDLTFDGGNDTKFAHTSQIFDDRGDGSGADITEFGDLAFDLTVDAASAVGNPVGDPAVADSGFFEFVVRDGPGFSFNSIYSQTLVPGTTTNVVIPSESLAFTSARAFTYQVFNGTDRALNGDVSYRIGNMRFVLDEPLLGDFDLDGDVDLVDLDRYNGNIGAAATGALEALDLDGDGTVEVEDFEQHYTDLVETSNGGKGTFAGDVNLDGTVNVLGDAFALVGNLNNPATSWSQGDLNADGTVNVLGDAFALVGNLGNTNGGSGAAPATSAVPEPGTVSLLIMLSSLGGTIRRRR